LQEPGHVYLLDWCHDDQPVWFSTRHGRILSVPYPQEVNDIPAIVTRQTTAPEFAAVIIDQFEEMRRQSQHQPLVMGMALHPYIVGQAHRVRHLRRALTRIAATRYALWLTMPGEIARFPRDPGTAHCSDDRGDLGLPATTNRGSEDRPHRGCAIALHPTSDRRRAERG